MKKKFPWMVVKQERQFVFTSSYLSKAIFYVPGVLIAFTNKVESWMNTRALQANTEYFNPNNHKFSHMM